MKRKPVNVHIISGLPNDDTVNPDQTLGDMGLDSLMAVEVKQVLEKHMDTAFKMKDIRQLTFAKIRKMANGGKIDNSQVDEASNSKTENEELIRNFRLRTEPIVKMKSTANEQQTKPLFLLHPVEGHIEALTEMVSHIRGDVYGLQCTKEAPTNSVEKLVAYYVKVGFKILKHPRLYNFLFYL